MISLKRLAAWRGNTCLYCGGETLLKWVETPRLFAMRHGITREAAGHRALTREHMVRIADGGPDRMENLAPACSYCNVKRDMRTVARHQKEMRAMVAAGTHPGYRQNKDGYIAQTKADVLAKQPRWDKKNGNPLASIFGSR